MDWSKIVQEEIEQVARIQEVYKKFPNMNIKLMDNKRIRALMAMTSTKHRDVAKKMDARDKKIEQETALEKAKETLKMAMRRRAVKLGARQRVVQGLRTQVQPTTNIRAKSILSVGRTTIKGTMAKLKGLVGVYKATNPENRNKNALNVKLRKIVHDNIIDGQFLYKHSISQYLEKLDIFLCPLLAMIKVYLLAQID